PPVLPVADYLAVSGPSGSVFLERAWVWWRAASDDVSSLKAGALYFIVVFAAGWVFGPVCQLLVVPRVGEAIGVLLEAPLMLLAMILAARWTMRRLAVSPSLVTRAAAGLVALGLLIVAELAGARWLRGL